MKLSHKIFFSRASCPLPKPLCQTRHFFQKPKNLIFEFIDKVGEPDENLKIILSSKQINKIQVYANDLLNRNCWISVEIDFVRNNIETTTLKYSGDDVGKILQKIAQDLQRSTNE